MVRSNQAPRVAAASFFAEFERLQAVYLGMVLRSLSDDAIFVEEASRLLEMDARLTLLRRLALAYSLPPTVAEDLEQTLSQAKKLSDAHTDLSRAMNAGESSNDAHFTVEMDRAKRRRGSATFRIPETSAAVPGSRLHTTQQIELYASETLELQGRLRALADAIKAARTSQEDPVSP